MEPVVFIPLALVTIFALAIPVRWRYRRPVRLAVVAALAVLFVNYVSWRVPVTVLPASTLDAQGILVWTLFAVELLAWFDSALLFAALSRRTNRSAEADAHEARLRALAEQQGKCPFGMCPSCRYFQDDGCCVEGEPEYTCMLVSEPLREEETAQLCVNFLPSR